MNSFIDVIAPASRCVETDLEQVKNFLTSWNVSYHLPDNLLGAHPFCANTDEMRLLHIKAALTNPTSTIIWCLRGGYGSMKLIPFLSQMTPPQKKKCFIGFSDITALHIFLQDQWGWETIHGPSLYSAAMNQVSADSLAQLKKILFEKNFSPSYPLHPLNPVAQDTHSIAGVMVGGNLTLVQSSLATSWQINIKNKILFIEEVNERGYRIDRMLEQLQQAGILQEARAIVIGDITGGKEPNGESLVKEAIQLFADSMPIPVFQITGVGHGFVNHPLILGRPLKIQKEKLAEFVILYDSISS